MPAVIATESLKTTPLAIWYTWSLPRVGSAGLILGHLTRRAAPVACNGFGCGWQGLAEEQHIKCDRNSSSRLAAGAPLAPAFPSPPAEDRPRFFSDPAHQVDPTLLKQPTNTAASPAPAERSSDNTVAVPSPIARFYLGRYPAMPAKTVPEHSGCHSISGARRTEHRKLCGVPDAPAVRKHWITAEAQ